MANRYNTINDPSLLTSVGGTVNDADSLIIGYFTQSYTDANLADRDLALVHTLPEWQGSFPADAPLIVDVDQLGTGEVINQFGGREFYLQAGAGGVIAKITHDPANNGVLTLLQMDTGDLIVRRGGLVASSVADINRLIACGGHTLMRPDGPAIAGGVIAAGTAQVDLHRDTASIEAHGRSRVNVLDTDVTPSGDVIIDEGASVLWGGGNCGGKLRLFGGTADFSRMRIPVAFGGNLEVYAASTMILKEGGLEPTFADVVQHAMLRKVYV